jgi:hypothetical protein
MESHCSVQFVRYVVVVFNSLFVLCGLALIGLGVWLFVDTRVVNVLQLTMDAHNSHLLRVSAIIIISIGCFLFVISLLGCIGAIAKNTVLLGIYLVLLLVAFCGEITGAVLAIAFKDWLLDQLRQVLYQSLTDAAGYYEQVSDGLCQATDIGALWDYVQVEMNCCGIESSPKTGYESLPYTFDTSCPSINISGFNKPLTCCQQDPDTAHIDVRNQATSRSNFHCPIIKTNGCLEEIESWIGHYSPVLIGIGLGVAMLQTIGIIFIVCLCVNSHPTSDGYKRQH